MAGTGRAQRRIPSKPASVVKEKYLTGPPLNIPSETQNVGCTYMRMLDKQPEKIHQVEAQTGTTETKGSLKERASLVANSLCARGVNPGDKVLICSKCDLDMSVTMLACLVCGAIIVPIYSDLTTEELHQILSVVQAKMIFCNLRTITQIDRNLKKLGQSAILVLYGNEKKSEAILFNNLVTTKAPKVKFEEYDLKDLKNKISFIFTTEGTCGSIKLCECSYYNLLARTKVWLTCFLDQTNKILSYLPVSSATQITMMCATLETNITRVLPGAFHTRNCCKLIHDLQIDTAVLSTDLSLQLFHRHSGVYDFNLSCLKRLIVVGPPIPTSKLKYVKHTFPSVETINLYGLTESDTISYSILEDDFVVEHSSKLVPGIQIYVKSDKTQEHLGPNLIGELMVGGPQLMARYYQNQHLNSTQFKRGFFCTGDLVWYNTEGSIFVKGKETDLLRIEDQFYHASELEDMMLKYRGIKEVSVISNEKEIVACIVKTHESGMTIESLQNFLEDKIDHIWMPSRLKFFEFFPKTCLGKVKKYLLMEEVFSYGCEFSEVPSLDIET